MKYIKKKTILPNFHFMITAFLTCLISSMGFSQVALVEYHGALKNMMHKGDITAKADLSDLKKTEHLYALGALENLKGEIQIFDSKPYNTMVDGKALMFDQSFSKKATLLVYASVSEWNNIVIPNNVVTYEQLEAFIKQEAVKNRIDTDAPFPFLIEGTAKSFDWHVIDWKEGDTEHSHKKHISSGLNGTVRKRQVEMLGFYSNAHHAIFTHHTTNMHIHVKTTDNKIAGHVDDLTLGKGMLLKLPAHN
ncbi:MAG: decarboxylase [Flavobacteriales bacterium]|jgi:acetolactate decarboxylase|nr:decarboxylase [Flavobacteriales bacterium]